LRVPERYSGTPAVRKLPSRLAEGDGGETVTPAAQFGLDCHGFEGYLGNVGPNNMGEKMP
jgi:hypothetical protein